MSFEKLVCTMKGIQAISEEELETISSYVHPLIGRGPIEAEVNVKDLKLHLSRKGIREDRHDTVIIAFVNKLKLSGVVAEYSRYVGGSATLIIAQKFFIS